MTAAPTLELVNLGLAYAPRQPILHDVCLRLAPGERLAVCGFSGAGKSTLLRLIAGLTAPTTGRIFFDGRDVTDQPPAARGVAWVPQRPTLWPGLTVAQNLAMPLQLLPRRQRPAPAAIAQRVRAAAEAFELAELLDRPCDQLSGGQAQRLALARVLVRPVGLWLLDEPLASLDPPLRWQVAQRLLLHREAIAATMVCVTHDWAEATTLAERIVLIADQTVSRPATADQLRADPRNPDASPTRWRPTLEPATRRAGRHRGRLDSAIANRRGRTTLGGSDRLAGWPSVAGHASRDGAASPRRPTTVRLGGVAASPTPATRRGTLVAAPTRFG
jgi:ABC-type sugar transport system ATPase subunit